MTHSEMPRPTRTKPVEAVVSFADGSFVEFGPHDSFGGHLFTSETAAIRWIGERYPNPVLPYTVRFR